MLIEGERKFKSLPNISKSSIKSFAYFCSYVFWKSKILKEKEEEGSMSKKADIGTDTHLIFSDFWSERGIEHDYIYTLDIEPMVALDDNPVTHYFYGVCMTLTPEYDRNVNVLQRIFWKFACLHAARFLYLYRIFNGNKIKVWEYFYPKEIEQFFTYEKYGLYGTIDTVFNDIDEKMNESLYIPDYKTGHIPASVMKGPKNISDETSVSLPTKFMFEIHFYGLLYLLFHGWGFEDERVDRFILNDEYYEDDEWYEFGLGKTKEEQAELNKTKKKYLTKLKIRLKKYDFKINDWDEIKYGDITLGIIFLSGDPAIESPVAVRKKFTYASLKTVLLRINELKCVLKNIDNMDYYLVKKMKTLPEYSKYRCPNCSRNEKCLKEIEEQFKKGF